MSDTDYSGHPTRNQLTVVVEVFSPVSAQAHG
jgi:hypothetical protein